MGKNWRGGRQKGPRGSKGGGGGAQDLSSCRGYGGVLATCDVCREREGSKELANLLIEAIETVYPEYSSNSNNNDSDVSESEDASLSIQEIMAREIAKVQSGSRNHVINPVTCVKTDIKGVVYVRINNTEMCPVKLVKAIFDRVQQDKDRLSRYVVRLVPLQYVFYPSEIEMMENFYGMIQKEFPGFRNLTVETEIEDLHTKKRKREEEERLQEKAARITDNCNISVDILSELEKSNDDLNEHVSVDEAVKAESQPLDAVESSNATDVDQNVNELDRPSQDKEEDQNPKTASLAVTSATFRPFSYVFSFKARNHNVLNKELVRQRVKQCLPSFARYSTHSQPQVYIVMEALKNIGGISFMKDVGSYQEFNLRKYQQEVVGEEVSFAKTSMLQKKVDDLQSCFDSVNNEGSEVAEMESHE